MTDWRKDDKRKDDKGWLWQYHKETRKEDNQDSLQQWNLSTPWCLRDDEGQSCRHDLSSVFSVRLIHWGTRWALTNFGIRICLEQGLDWHQMFLRLQIWKWKCSVAVWLLGDSLSNFHAFVSCFSALSKSPHNKFFGQSWFVGSFPPLTISDLPRRRALSPAMVGVSQGSRLALCSKGIFEACAGPGQENPVGKDANATRLRNDCKLQGHVLNRWERCTLANVQVVLQLAPATADLQCGA